MQSKRVWPFLAISVIAIAISIVSFSFNFLEKIENKSWDFRLVHTARGKAGTDDRIKIIVIDQASLDLYAREQGITWPWPRTLYIPVLRYLKAAGARGVAFDIIFSESSVHGVDEDKEFAAALGNTITTVSTIAPGIVSEGVVFDRAIFEQLKNKHNTAVAAASYLAHDEVVRFTTATFPIPEIIAESTALGSAWAAPDSDGVFRHYWPGGYLEDLPILSLAFAMHAATVEGAEIEHLADFLDDRGRLTIRFHGGQNSYETIPIADVISSYVSQFEEKNGTAPIVPLDTFKDSWVFIGVWAPGLLDLRPVPLDEIYKGVEYHATVLDNLLHNDLVRKVPLLPTVFYSALFITLIVAAVFFIRNVSLQICCYVITIGLFFYSGYLLAVFNYWIAMVVPLFSITAALIASLAFQYYSEGRERRFLKNAFSHYVSPKVIQRILEDPKSLSLGGEKRELTIFFSDLEGFTSISETLAAEQLVALLNTYLSAMTDILLESGATLDKYEGDAIIAFWNAPVAIPQHPYSAVKAALKCQQKLKDLGDPFREEFGVELKMRIGLHTGVVNVGNFGSKERFDYTVIGDAANIAARLEGVNKVFGTKTLISESTQQQLAGKIACRKLGAIKVVGKANAITVYEPLPDVFNKAHLEKFNAALELFECGAFEEALELLKTLPEDPAAQAYVRRIEEAPQDGIRDTVWILASK